MKSSAFIQGPYRYNLFRHWGPLQKQIAWVMLNPSTADADTDDATIRRCIAFSKGWGFHGLRVANLFALRATDPKELRRSPDPIGRLNDVAIDDLCRNCDMVICAWGSHGDYLGRSSKVLKMLSGFPICHLGLTKSGQPKHPLYLRSETIPIKFHGDLPGASHA